MKSNLFLITIVSLLPVFACAQVGVNTTTPNAALDIQSTNNGVLIPRVQLTDALDIVTVTNPAGGALATSTLVYNIVAAGVVPNIVTPGFYFWNGARWMPIAGNEGWKLDGNTGITQPASPTIYGTSTIGTTENFVGTTDNKDFVIGTNNLERMRIDRFGNASIGAIPFSNVKLYVKNYSPFNQIGAYIETTGTGNNNSIGVAGISNNGPGFGTGGNFLGGENGINSYASSGNFAGTTYGIRGLAFGTNGFGTRVGGYFDASSGVNNYALITDKGQVGIGTATPNLAQLQVEKMIGNTTAMFRGNATSQGISFAADWPGLYFNCYYNGGQKTMAPSGFPSIINTDQSIGGLTFHTSNIANVAADALLATNIPERMRIDADGEVGIGTNNPLAKLHIVNSTSGAIRIEDGTQANGYVLRSDANGVGTWQNSNSFAWSLTGNTVNAATHFLGSTNDADIVFKRNNTEAGRLGQYRTSLGYQALQFYTNSFLENIAIGNDALRGNSNPALNTGVKNTAVGRAALISNSSGTDNTAIGYSTLSFNNANSNNTAIGSFAMQNSDSRTTGITSNNTAVGFSALRGSAIAANNTGINNTAVGVNAMLNTTSGFNNTAIGLMSLYDNTTGSYNTAIGNEALQTNVGNSRSTAVGFMAMLLSDNRTSGRDTYNTAVGTFALHGGNFANLNTGQYNSAIGDAVLFFNSSGSYNTGTGSSALYSNTTGTNNTGIGSNALYSNTTGSYNTAIGTNAGISMTTAVQNVAIGDNALDSNIISGGNTAVGYDALQATTGDFNTAFGNSSLFSFVSGNSNCAFGYNSLLGLTSGVNNIGIGTNTAVPSATGSNQIRMGNTAITYAGIQVAWSITSDNRWKSNIQKTDLGLAFINKLNPVSYFRKNDESKKTEYGFIAQELEKTLGEFGSSNNGIITKDDEGMLSVRYNDLMAPMVKAIQELKTENDSLKKQNEDLEARLKKIEEKLNK